MTGSHHLQFTITEDGGEGDAVSAARVLYLFYPGNTTIW